MSLHCLTNKRTGESWIVEGFDRAMVEINLASALELDTSFTLETHHPDRGWLDIYTLCTTDRAIAQENAT